MEKIGSDAPEICSADGIAENVRQLQILFPEAFIDGTIDFDVLRQLLGNEVDDRVEKYGLYWHGKRCARQLALTPSTGTLRPCPEESVEWDKTQNLLIEGDNLEVLKLLQKSYAGKVKLIYIDPPYNTGNDSIYFDDYSDNIASYVEFTRQIDSNGRALKSNTEASGRFHTNWLNMMYPRLKLAKTLLSEEGMLTVSCDGGEVGNLRLILDELFGEENLIETLIWRKRRTQANLAKFIAPVHEYILVYARHKDSFAVNRVPYTKKFIEDNFSNPDGDPRGLYQTRPLAQPATSSNPEYEITLPNGRKLSAKWSCSPETFERYVAEERLFVPLQGKGMPRLKVFLHESKGMLPNTLLLEEGSMEEGSNELKDLFDGQSVFSFPKPLGLLQYLLMLGTVKDSLVMDFFAGSGTTGHAVMAQNASDGGFRRCISIQLPEAIDQNTSTQKVAANFCDSIDRPRSIVELTKERLRRAARAIARENPEVDGDLGFRVFKLDTSNIHAWAPDNGDLDKTLFDRVDNIKQGRSEEDILFELFIKLGLDLCVPIETRIVSGKPVHSVGAGTLIACLAESISRREIEPLALGIVEWHGEQAPAGESMVVFRDNAFEDDVAKTNCTAILKQHGLTNVRSL